VTTGYNHIVRAVDLSPNGVVLRGTASAVLLASRRFELLIEYLRLFGDRGRR
jgi:hypothetical protein